MFSGEGEVVGELNFSGTFEVDFGLYFEGDGLALGRVYLVDIRV